MQPNLTNLFILLLDDVLGKKISFIDLNYKRLVFIEPLLTPYLKRIAVAALQSYRGYQITELQMNNLEIVKFFVAGKQVGANQQPKLVGLQGKYLYDSCNLLSGMLLYKICMINPGSEKIPKEVANIHPSHYQKICPISISDKDPGENLYLLPNVKVNYIGQIL